jgi:signal transduction histidine kinase
VYLVVFLLALRRALRTPTPGHRDTAVFFGDAVLLILLVSSMGPSGPALARPVSFATAALAMALPYLLLRVVVGFAQTPTWIIRAAEAGLLLSVIGLALAGDPAPTWLVLWLVAYFIAVAAYDTFAFTREAMHSGGVTQRRVQAAAVGSFALGGAVVFAAAAGLDPARVELWTILLRVMALGSAIAYYIGFTPPRWLRQAWQVPALQAFLLDIARFPYLADLQAVLTELERHAAAVVGVQSAAIGLWQEAEGVLRFWTGLGGRATLAEYPEDLRSRDIVPHQGMIDIPPNRILSGRAFLEQRPVLATDVRREDPDNLSLYIASDVRAVLAAPISAGNRKLGVLTAWSSRPPVFAESDIELLQLVALQAATVFESRDLLHEVADARARAEADRLKDAFLASLSHDLRNPLTAVGATAQLVRRRLDRAGELDLGRLRTNVASIELSAQQMTRLVDQLLDYARLQMDRPLDLNRQQTDMVELARRVVALHESVSEHHSVELDASEVSIVGNWDAARIERVLQNLLSNAIKYSPRGGKVRVSVSREAASASAGTEFAVISVQDEGVGIPAAELPRIFERFHRGANVRDQIAGTGIGLATARHVIEQHGGTIAVYSEENRGTTFTIRLPECESVNLHPAPG